jgi:L-lactate dehydrogenase complex protein LldF
VLENAGLIDKFTAEVTGLGIKVITAESAEEAVNYIVKLVKERGIKTAVHANSTLSIKLELNNRLEECGVRVLETSVVKWILQMLKGNDVPIEEVVPLICSASGEKVGTDTESVLKAARKVLKEAYANTDLGISVADFGIAGDGSLVTLESGDNARLAAALPRLHLTLLDAGCVVADIAAATEKIKQTSGDIPGSKVSNFITYLTGKTASDEILDASFARVQAPDEEMVLLVNLH